MLIYAGSSPEYEIPDGSLYYMIIADLIPGIGNEIYFFFDDEVTFKEAKESLEFGSWLAFEVVPHSVIAFRPGMSY